MPGKQQLAVNGLFLSVLATITAAAIVANVAMLFHLSDRLARVETKLELLAGNKQQHLTLNP